MAKGAYTFISYPESSDIEKIKIALDSANWDYCISPLHDKDKKEDGTIKKAHYHWIVGFRRKIPDYKQFKSYIKEVGGVVGKYNDTVVHDVEQLYLYLTHENEVI
jgi:hypothetical protein